MTELVVQIEDNVMTAPIRRAIMLMRGVRHVSKTRKRKTGLDRAIEDIKQGHVYEAVDVDDLMRQLSE